MFIIGLISRISVNYVYGVNLYLDLINLPIWCYSCISTFIVLVHEFNLKNFSDLKLEDFKFLSIKNLLKGFIFNGLIKNKMFVVSNVNEMKPYKEKKNNFFISPKQREHFYKARAITAAVNSEVRDN